MKKISFILIATLFSAATMFTTSCSKELGCMDPDSKNYNPSAEKDDGSCAYEGKVIFWYGEATANGLTNDGAVSLTYYVDGKIVGSSSANVYWNGQSAPDCGQEGLITVTKDLKNVKTQSYSYSVKDQTGFEYWSGTLNFNANTCYALELSWNKREKGKK